MIDFTHTITVQIKPSREGNGPKTITIEGKKYPVHTVVHNTFDRWNSDVRYWFPIRIPYEKVLYAYSIIPYHRMTLSQRRLFFPVQKK